MLKNALAYHQIHSVEISWGRPVARAPYQVLIVDDSILDACLIRHQVEDSLDRRFFAFTEVPRLIDAFELIDEMDFDLILLDLNLLDTCGLATVSAMHAHTPFTPIVVFSSQDDPTLMAETKLCGALDFLIKGHIAPEMLKNVLQHTLTPTCYA